jgi:hypothetical protein
MPSWAVLLQKHRSRQATVALLQPRGGGSRLLKSSYRYSEVCDLCWVLQQAMITRSGCLSEKLQMFDWFAVLFD